MQDLMRWDPFTALSPTPPRWETVGFSPHFDVGETLPDGADLDACEAELKNGVLFISIPKRADHRSRSISITAIGEKVKGRLGGKDKGQA
jgi:HSP20 family molecular chaperone IbpA